jgi:hypothetical protein
MLVVALVVLLMSAAIAFKLRAAAPSAVPVNAMLSAQWEIELALRRIESQARSCTMLNRPHSTVAGTTLEMLAQLDPEDCATAFPISYSLVTGPDGSGCLQESDPRLGTSILLHHVQSLEIHLLHARDPQVIVISITAGKAPNLVARTVHIMPRGL